MHDNSHKVNIVSFFSGYGGLEMGISHAMCGNTRVIAYVEREAFPDANLLAKAENGLMDKAPVFADITTFPYKKFRGLVDIACGGVPCQPHSHAGQRKGGTDERFLFDVFIEGMAEMRPGIIFIENVEGLLSSKMPDGTLCIRYVLNRLEEIGYCVENNKGEPLIGIFSAAEVGAPHQRKRVFILAHSIAVRCHGRTLQNRIEKRSIQEPSQSQWPEAMVRGEVKGCGGNLRSWPSRPGEPQYEWEPPRVVGNTAHDNRRTGKRRKEARAWEEGKRWRGLTGAGGRKIKSPLGRGIDGPLSRMGYAELCVSCDNRTDELRLLGNGVVPAVAAKAWVTLMAELEDKT